MVVVFGDDGERKEHSGKGVEAYLCSFLDEESRKRYIYGGVAFLPLLVKLVDLCCNSRQPHRSPPYLSTVVYAS